MKINIPVGTRDTADHFWGNYTEKFLKKIQLSNDVSNYS